MPQLAIVEAFADLCDTRHTAGHHHLVQSWVIARNLYRHNGFENIAQAQRLAGFGLSTLKLLFRMK